MNENKKRRFGRREFLAVGGSALAATAAAKKAQGGTCQEVNMSRYEAKDYAELIGMDGFGRDLLSNHFSLYEGYVANTNRALETLSTLSKENGSAAYQYGEVKRRLGWEWNGMRLHELYFDNLGGTGVLSEASSLRDRVAGQFGSYTAWEEDFKATGSMRGIGWAILYHDPIQDTLLNMWIDEHDVAHPAGCTPILVMDVFEHAFMLDYGLNKGEYIEAFFRNIRWEEATKRLASSREVSD